ncbi:MAG: hypothetical protein R3C01_10060 [Planctomycetaceae bacterium]
MSSARYRRLLTNLPSMAAVVNSFQSADVQLAVYQTLIESLDEATSDDSSRESTVEMSSARSSARRAASRSQSNGSSGSRDDSALADIVEGDSIHSIAAE